MYLCIRYIYLCIRYTYQIYLYANTNECVFTHLRCILHRLINTLEYVIHCVWRKRVREGGKKRKEADIFRKKLTRLSVNLPRSIIIP